LGVEWQKEKHNDGEIFKSLYPLLAALSGAIFETSPPPIQEFFSYDSCVDRLKPFSASLRKDLMPPTHLPSPEKNSLNFRRRFGLIQKLFDFPQPTGEEIKVIQEIAKSNPEQLDGREMWILKEFMAGDSR
jgi:hypothetical protein